MLVQALIALVPCFTITFLRWVAGFWLLKLVVREKKSVRSTVVINRRHETGVTQCFIQTFFLAIYGT